MPSSPLSRDILNLGAGNKKRADAVNLDLSADTHPDVVHDLEKRPWPFPDNTFREVHAYDVLEHLSDTLAALEELHRICQPGARVKLTVPHFSSANAFVDPTHKRFFSAQTFQYVTGEHEFSFYTRTRFRLVHRSIVFEPSLVNKVVRRLANRYPEAYERRWAWMFPAWFLYAELEVVKPA